MFEVKFNEHKCKVFQANHKKKNKKFTKVRKIIFGKGMKIGQMAQKSQICAANSCLPSLKKTRSGVKDAM